MKKILCGLVIALMMTGSGYAYKTVHLGYSIYNKIEQKKNGLTDKEIKNNIDKLTYEYRKLCNDAIQKGVRVFEYKKMKVILYGFIIKIISSQLAVL